MEWKVRAIRGATTVSENTPEAIREAVLELLTAIESHNAFEPEDVVSVIFTATPDLDAIFPAAVARELSQWEHVPLLDVQQMQVRGSLPRCIRILIQVNMSHSQETISHLYLRGARNLRPDLTAATKPSFLE